MSVVRMLSKIRARFGAVVIGATVLAAVGLIPSAGATTVEFASPDWVYNTSDQPNWLVSIDDNTAGFFRIDLSIASPSTSSGDMLGFAFDTTLTGLTLADLTFVSSSTGQGITGLFSNSLVCGAGCNFNGATGDAFDYIVRLGAQGSALGSITAFEFLIATKTILDANTFTRVGIRAQSTGPLGQGSTKDINSAPTVVPVPPALSLLGTGLGLLGAFRLWSGRRRVVAAT